MTKQSGICRALTLLSILSCIQLLAGCAAQNSRAPFVWTTDHRLSPGERFLSVDASPQTIFEELSTWVRNHGGEIVKTEERLSYIFKIQPDSEDKFTATRAIAQQYWTALAANKYEGFKAEDSHRLKDLTEQQIVTEQSDSSGYLIEAKLRRRTATILYEENAGGSILPIFNPGFSTLSPRGIVHVPGSLTTFYQAPQSQTRRMINYFSSLIRFYVFSDHGQTKVFATGAPVNESASAMAGYDRTIGRAWWSNVTGKEEETLIKDAYSFLAHRGE